MSEPTSAVAILSLDKARKLIADASRMLDAELTDAAGRDAYLAAFHGARALIGQTLGDDAVNRIRTHDGVQRIFSGLLRDVPGGTGQAAQLSRLYTLKQTHDYEFSSRPITMQDAAGAVKSAEDLIGFCVGQIDEPVPELTASAQAMSASRRAKSPGPPAPTSVPDLAPVTTPATPVRPSAKPPRRRDSGQER